MAGIEHNSLDPRCFLNSARTKNWLDDLAHVHHRNEVIVSAADKREIREKPNTVDPKFAGSRLGTDDTMLASKGDGPVHGTVIRKLVELGDVRKRDVGTIVLLNDCPVASQGDGTEQ